MPTISYQRARNLKRTDKVILPNGTYEVAGKTKREDGKYEVTYKGGRITIFDGEVLLKIVAGILSNNKTELPGYMGK